MRKILLCSTTILLLMGLSGVTSASSSLFPNTGWTGLRLDSVQAPRFEAVPRPHKPRKPKKPKHPPRPPHP